MPADSQLLPLLAAGSVKHPEENSKVNVNCISADDDKDSAAAGRSPLENVTLTVLFPKKLLGTEDPNKDVIPGVGGAIVKLELAGGTEINTKKPKKYAEYDTSKLASYISGEIPHVPDEPEDEGDEKPFVSISNLAKVRVNVNKALENMPVDSTPWHECDVPTLVLSKTRTTAFPDKGALQGAIDEKKAKKMRVKEFGKPVGYFKFIPIQVLNKLFDALMNAPASPTDDPNDYGMWKGEYYGISGASFNTLADAVKGALGESGDLEDEDAAKILLDIFPIIRVKSSDITGNNATLPNIGYYTALKDSLYVKMPDLSGRDSNGYAQNIYGLGPKTDGNIQWAFEFVKHINIYAAKAFDFQPPPAPSVEDGDAEFPFSFKTKNPNSNLDAPITILKEGLDDKHIDNYKFFLSPILPAGSSTSSRGFITTNRAVEIFTAPVLTAPYYQEDISQAVVTFSEKAVSQLVYEFSDKTQTGKMEKYNLVFNDTSVAKRQVESTDTGKLTHLEFSANAKVIEAGAQGVHYYQFEELGLPMSENLSDFGVDSIADILGEANRPEILLGFRDGKGPEKDNEGKIYDPKVYSAKNLLASNRPNIILNEETQIPAIWIPLGLDKMGSEDDFYTLNIPFLSDEEEEGPRSALEIYNEMGFLEFALYVVDHMGQIVRAPGKNIRITPNSPLLEFVEPHGFAGKQGNVPINLGTTLHPGLTLFAENTLQGLNLKGEGFVGTNPTINFYSDKEGQNLVSSLKDGMKVGVKQDKIRIVDTGEHTLAVESFATFGDILPALVGTYYLGVQLPTGSTSDLIPFYISNAGTKKDDLPEPKDVKITFKDSFGLEVKGFDKGVHSIPIIQDAVNHAKITIQTEKKTFKSNPDAILFAYIAVLKNEPNKNILLSDVGWLQEAGVHQKDSIIEANIKTAVSESVEFYIPTELQWKFATGDFKRDSARKATIKFPGTENMDINLSRFTELTAGNNKKEYPAYILLTNSELSTGANIPSFIGENGGTKEDGKFNYAVIPIGSPGDKDPKEPAFAAVPEILGFVAELPSDGGENRVVSNIPQASLMAMKEVKSKIEGGWWSGGISLESIKTDINQNFSIIAADELKRLAIVFRGNEVPRMEKMHKASIGSKKLDDECVDVEFAEDNMIVASYKDISGIKSEGWTDVVIKRTDERFKCSYDSTLYNRVTIDVDPVKDKDTFIDETDGKLLPEPPSTEAENLLIPRVINVESGSKFVDYQGNVNLSTVIFPGGVGKFSPLPLIPHKTMKPTDPASDINSYFQFSNPIKVKPSLDLVFGESVTDDEGNLVVHGMGLTDSPIADNNEVVTEIIKLSKSGQISVAMGLLDMIDAIEKAKKEAEAVIQNIKANIKKVTDKLKQEAMEKKLAEAEQNYNDTSQAAVEATETAEKSVMSKEDADKAAMDAAMAGAQSEGSEGGSSAVDALNDAAAGAAEAAAAAMGAVGDAVDGINDALGMLQTISDALSSIANIANQIAAGVESAAASLGARPNDFVKVNAKYIYIDKGTTIKSNEYKAREDKKKFKLTTNFKFSQAAAIKFNVPEIVSITKDGDDIPYTLFGDRPFSKLQIKSGDKIVVQMIGADEDTKLEIAGKRVDTIKDSPFSSGIFQNFKVTVPNLSAFPIFGTSDCISITATNSNASRMRLGRMMGNNLTLNLESDWTKKIFGGGRNKEGPGKDIAKFMEDLAYLKFCNVKLAKAMGGAKESMQSFCDFSFKLTAELSLQLRNLQVLMIPIKVIFCIIDVICALLNPWRLAFAIIRLFLCLYDLILLLPQLAVPAMFLALLLHLLNLLLCVILKILSWINAINEIITALDRAIEYKNYPAIAALEETLNEHLFSLETDISVLEPIITILNLFMQLLQLAFAFPCRVGSDDDDEACIDPSQLAGIILGKVAPTGAIAPNVLLPLAQAYTRLPPESAGYYGNSPPEGRDKSSEISVGGTFADDIDGGAAIGGLPATSFDVVVRPQDNYGAVVARAGTPGEDIPMMMSMSTGETKQIQEGGYFRGDADSDGMMDNIYYPRLRTQFVENTPGEHDFIRDDKYFGASDGFFDATFALSYTKGTKDWGFFTGPDPRFVRFNFDSGGVTNDIAWWTWWLIFPIFFSKKTVSAIQTIDSRPMFLGVQDGGEEDGSLIIDAKSRDFVSPIDGFSDFLRRVGSGYQPKPLTVTFELNEPAVDPNTHDAIFVPKMVTKTFGNIPMIAVVDHEFNVYFIEKDGSNGGIRMSGNSIDSMHLKMLNKPSAPKHKTSRQKDVAFRDKGWRWYKSHQAETAAWLATPKGGEAWFNNTSSNHEVGETPPYPNAYAADLNPLDHPGVPIDLPGHEYLVYHPVALRTETDGNYYEHDGPIDEATGDPEYKAGDNKFKIYKTGEAIMRATANAAWMKSEIAESSDLYYNGKKVADYLHPDPPDGWPDDQPAPRPQAPAGNDYVEYILHTTSKWRYNRALRCVWGHEPDPLLDDAGDPILPTPEPGEAVHGGWQSERVTQTLKNKTVTFTLSNQVNGSSPYDTLKHQWTAPGSPPAPGEPAPAEAPYHNGIEYKPEWHHLSSREKEHIGENDANGPFQTENGDPYWPVGSRRGGGQQIESDHGDPVANPNAIASAADVVPAGQNWLKDPDGNAHEPPLTDWKSGDGDTPADRENRFGPLEIHIRENLTGSGFEIQWTEEMENNLPYPEMGFAYDFGAGSIWEQRDIGNSITAVKTYDFPQFYIVDMRQLADDIASACGAAGPAELLMDLPGFEEPFEENVQEAADCVRKFMDSISSDEIGEDGKKKGFIDRVRDDLEAGVLPGRLDPQDTMDEYQDLVDCINDQIDKACKFVVNPLNTGFKLLGDTDETPLPQYIDPEHETNESLLNQGIVDELEFDDELAGFPSITGAMEYASGIGDTIIAEVESKALIEVLPRDCYDDPMQEALDLSGKIEIDFVSDETAGAELVSPIDGSPVLVIKDGEKYTLAVTTLTPGKVVLKGSICGIVIQAVTDKGIVSGQENAAALEEGESAESLEGCIEDAVDDGFGDASDTEDDSFAPGSLMKVDRLLTILFVPKGAAGTQVPGGMGGPGGLYGDSDRDASARSAKPSPQTSGTKLEN